MPTYAAVMTGAGTGPIATIGIFGHQTKRILKRIFKSTDQKPPLFKKGTILLGKINGATHIIDEVIIGCEGSENLTINCHGNPLIVSEIMETLSKQGVQLITSSQLLHKILSKGENLTAIQIEAKLTQVKAKTLAGTKIIANQIHAGLNQKLKQLLTNIDAAKLDSIRRQAEQILDATKVAKLIVYGCKTVLTGPPNSGKSTLFNCLCGEKKALVTDIEGTTRDWISTTFTVEPLFIELVDTAGLDLASAAAKQNTVKKIAQDKTNQLLKQADVILLILDGNNPTQPDGKYLKKIQNKKVITVLNKSDLPTRLDVSRLPKALPLTVQTSAKFGTGMENLIEQIHTLTGSKSHDLRQTAAFTGRQEGLLRKLKQAKSRSEATSIIKELLSGQLCV